MKAPTQGERTANLHAFSGRHNITLRTLSARLLFAQSIRDDSFFNLTKTFGSAIELQAAWYRNRVCERVVVGKKKVEVPVMQEVGKQTVEQDIVEWKCPKVLEPMAPAELLEESSNDIPF